MTSAAFSVEFYHRGNSMVASQPVNQRIILKNTLFLYVRMLALTFAGLYAVRILLNSLGAHDYGIYNAVAGIVTLLAFLSNSMASSTQRYFAFALGKKNQDMLRCVFCTNLRVYFFIILLTVFFAETAGLFFLNQKLALPADRLAEANCVYQFAVLTLICQIFTTPFVAMIIAHEDMHLYTFASAFDVFLKLLSAYVVSYFSGSKIVGYALLHFISLTFSVFIYLWICRKKYPECHFQLKVYDKKLFKEIFCFTGWTLFGSMTSVIRGQMVTLLLNQMFTNPVLVASKVIALNVSQAVGSFSNNFNIGLYPSIVKCYASGAKQDMYRVIFVGSKITFFLMWFLTFPLLLRMDFVLSLWLNSSLEYSVLFTQLALIEALILSVSLPLTTAARAVGNMKTYELVLGSMQILIFPISWIVLTTGYPPYSVFIVAIGMNVLMFIARLIIVHHLCGISIQGFIYKVFFPAIWVVILSGIPCYYLNKIIPEGFVGSCTAGLTTCTISGIMMFCFGFTREQRCQIINLCKTKLKQGALK